MSLTPHQQNVYKRIEAFLASDDPGVFILQGYAGTGKTFLLQQLATQLAEEKKKFTLLASTGRAASVLRAKTNFIASTVHSELYLFRDVEGDDENLPHNASFKDFGSMKLLFSLRGTDEADVNKVYIVDEASMISNVSGNDNSYAEFGSGLLLNDLMATVGQNRIIFSGDPCQLPPVFQTESPALTSAWFTEKQFNVQEASLSEIVRHKADSGILQLATEVRKMVQNLPEDKFPRIPAVGKEHINLLYDHEMWKTYRQFIEKNGFEKSIAICPSNKNCHAINNYIRKYRYGNDKAALQEGDILMVTQNNYLAPLLNGDFIEVISIGNKRSHCQMVFVEVRVKALHNKEEYEILLCNDVLFNGQPNLTHDQQKMLMIDYSIRMRKKGIKPKSVEYKDGLRADPYLNSLRANFGYAVTCHKSQGGEWEHVFFFLNRFMFLRDKEELLRLWYTGITRAKEQLYLTKDISWIR